MTDTLKPQLRYGIDAYLDWVEKEGLLVHEGVSLNLFEVETADWPRLGAKAAVLHFAGRGDWCNMFVMEIGPGKSTLPQRHIYEEISFVLEGRGSTQLEFADGTTRSFEWGPRSLIAIPINAKYRHFNGSGTERVLMSSTTDLPLKMKVFHNENFIFDNAFDFSDRIGKEEFYSGQGELHMIRPGNNMWETNFVPDLGTLELTPWEDRGPGSTNIMFALGDGIMHSHMSEIAPATYKKAHRHAGGTHVMTLTGGGYSLLWYDGDQDFQRVEWSYGVVFPPLQGQFHQHFVTSNNASRYLATGMGGMRYPLTEEMRAIAVGTGGKKMKVSLSVKDGGDQIEFEDQDPRIHQIWLEEMRKRNITPKFELPKKK